MDADEPLPTTDYTNLIKDYSNEPRPTTDYTNYTN